QSKTPIGQSGYDRKRGQVKLEKMRANHLAGDADIGKPGVSAKSEWHRSSACQQPFVCTKPLGRPMPTPLLDAVCICSKSLGKMAADPRRYQRMCISDRHQCQ